MLPHFKIDTYFSILLEARLFLAAAGFFLASPTHSEVARTLTILEGGRRRRLFRLQGSIRSFLSAWPECVQSVEFKQDGLYRDCKSPRAFY